TGWPRLSKRQISPCSSGHSFILDGVSFAVAGATAVSVCATLDGDRHTDVLGFLEEFAGDARDFFAVLDDRGVRDADFAARFADAAAFHQQEEDMLLHV